jgi:6-phospho-3-hexuloisomerase
VPAISIGDLLLISSGSGETQTIYDIARIGKESGASLALVTGNKDSRIGKLADVIVFVNAPSKFRKAGAIRSDQPMTTLNDQCLQIFYDTIVLRLMEKLNRTYEDMHARHSNLE